MPSILPEGDPAPDDGRLPAHVARRVREAESAGAPRTFSLYVHVPFCEVRCGYCDFNTYTAEDLGPGASRSSYAGTVTGEFDFAAGVLAASDVPARQLETVFFGGGTPTLLPAADLVGILGRAREVFGLAPGAEVTTEANPDSVTARSLAELAAGGFTRVSFGMQSAVPHVLATLDRTHRPENVPAAVGWARDAGLEVSLDLIYGTPGESLEDWRTTVEAALALRPDHVSAYSLIVEEGTKFGSSVKRGVQADVDPDDQADKYLLAERLLAEAGYRWYEISNWALDPLDEGIHRARHNMAYWRDQDWWGAGPGAHSHLAGVRFWNAKHPAAYAQRLATGVSPSVGREEPDAEARFLERVMLGVRLSEGLETSVLDVAPDGGAQARGEIAAMIAEGLLDGRAALAGRIIPTLQGRLLDDAIVRRLAGF
ncbi:MULTISPECIES: radical SAM family heme chaperone HemW [Micrococcaceae]|uniref:radical SAM family heme chaperone HemW n=1 Tax=Micrococcaceae TaxID=1268 RepID=UPI0016221D0B|nr:MULTISPECIES: radical SAM family heme chaperone HemW [Micrococcaceae]MBB5749058.1 oxygen-independent coproporphyrinogen-3 oxidase [Micrococcus sp. TA1]HRO31127.1 radical SAM family heme chaperone HemW [Citricoccus sp.]